MSKSMYLKIARSMNHVAQLPEDDSLVFALGAGNEQNNVEALANWVKEQTDLLEMNRADHLLERLLHRLHNKLDSFNAFLYE